MHSSFVSKNFYNYENCSGHICVHVDTSIDINITFILVFSTSFLILLKLLVGGRGKGRSGQNYHCPESIYSI